MKNYARECHDAEEDKKSLEGASAGTLCKHYNLHMWSSALSCAGVVEKRLPSSPLRAGYDQTEL